MAFVSGAVYDPPRADLPYIAVIFGPDGEVLTARIVPTIAAGEKLLVEVMKEQAKKLGVEVKVR